jgi:putative endonuclease
LTKRLKEHQSGRVFSTKGRIPLKLIYYGFCLNQEDAKRKEKYLITAWGKRYIKKVKRLSYRVTAMRKLSEQEIERIISLLTGS